MFQKLGLKDIFVEIWYRRMIILIIAGVAVLIAMISAIIGYSKSQNEEGKETVYTKTVYVNVDAADQFSYATDPIGQSQKVRNSYYSVCNSEYFAQYLQKNVKAEKELSEYLVCEANIETIISNKNIRNILSALTFTNPSDSTAIKLSFRCYDDEIGNQIIDLLIPYMKDELQVNLGDATFSEIARSSFEDNITNNSNGVTDFLKNFIKNAIIFGVLFEFVYLLAVLFMVMIKPRIHTSNDLKLYFDAPVWEIK